MPRPERSGGYLELAWPRFKAAQYYFCTSAAANATNATLGNGTLRLAPWFVPAPTTFTKIGAEFTVAGEAASVLRIGIYAMDSGGYPTVPVLDAGTISTGTGDAGTIATGGTPGVYEITTTFTLARGWYHVGGAVQSAPTVQPTIRIANNGNVFEELPCGSSIPVAGLQAVAFANAGVSGAFGAWGGGTGAASASPRIHVKVL